MGNTDPMYEIHQTAYIKLILHALKHSTSAVNAVLIGRVSGDSTDTVEIVDSVPLFHSQISLLPPLEIALIMIEEYYNEKGLGIVGYFHANERFNDLELGVVAKNIGDHISKYLPQAALFLLYTKDASRSWKIAGSDGRIRLTLKEPSANVVLLDFISSEKWNGIVDFDDHLDDISKDWLNPDLFK